MTQSWDEWSKSLSTQFLPENPWGEKVIWAISPEHPYPIQIQQLNEHQTAVLVDDIRDNFGEIGWIYFFGTGREIYG